MKVLGWVLLALGSSVAFADAVPGKDSLYVGSASGPCYCMYAVDNGEGAEARYYYFPMKGRMQIGSAYQERNECETFLSTQGICR